MRSKILSKRGLLIVASSGFIISVALILNFIPNNSTHSSSASPVNNAAVLPIQEPLRVELPVRIGLPVRLKIPAISVDSAVIPVGIASDGTMDVPKNPAEVAWFNLGPHPGEQGSAVIAGHYDWFNKVPAVFEYLHTLRKGDEIFVEDEEGVTTTFVVREIRTYGKEEDVPDVFALDDGTPHLNLITCTGVWNKAGQTYSKRLVVFTDKVF